MSQGEVLLALAGVVGLAGSVGAWLRCDQRRTEVATDEPGGARHEHRGHGSAPLAEGGDVGVDQAVRRDARPPLQEQVVAIAGGRH